MARCRPRGSPGRRDRRAGARRARSGHRPRVAASSSRSISMPWPGRRRPDGDGSAGPAPAAPTPTAPAIEAGDLPTALAAAINDPSRIEVHAGSAIASLEPWLAAQAAVGIGLLLDDPRPRRGVPLALAVAGTRWPDGRGRGPGRRRDAARAPRPAGDPGRRPRGQAVPGRPDRRRSRRARDAGRVRHPDRRLRAQCRPAQPDHRRRRGRAARPHPAARRGARQRGAGRPGGAVRDRRPRAARAASRRRRPRPAVRRARAAAHRGAGPDGGDRRRPRPRGARRAGPRVRDRDLAARVGDLPRRRPRVQPRQPQAARADPVLRAQPAQGQADEDRLFDRCLGARGPAARPSDDRQAPRVADLHEAALDVRGCAADPDGRRRPSPHDVPPGRRRDRPAVLVRPEPPEHPDPDAARPADPARLRGRRART